MTQPDTLHTRIRFRIDVLLAIARAATPGPWDYATVRGVTSIGAPGILPSVAADVHFDIDVHYLVAFSPEVTIAWLEGELETLERHKPMPATCWHDCGYVGWPCADILLLARRLGVST